jgi:hypothetical protein
MGPTRGKDPRPGYQRLEALYRQAQFHGVRSGRCLPHGIPDEMLISVPLKIVQNPGLTLIL